MESTSTRHPFSKRRNSFQIILSERHLLRHPPDIKFQGLFDVGKRAPPAKCCRSNLAREPGISFCSSPHGPAKMDFTNRVGHKMGGGGPASSQEMAMDRRERLRRLALETIDLSKDPYFMKNHLGQFECKLCLTLHVNEASYLSHTQGKKHQVNLGRRAAKEKIDVAVQPQPKVVTKKKDSQNRTSRLLRHEAS